MHTAASCFTPFECHKYTFWCKLTQIRRLHNTVLVFFYPIQIRIVSGLHYCGVNVHHVGVTFTLNWCSHSCKNLHFFGVTITLALFLCGQKMPCYEVSKKNNYRHDINAWKLCCIKRWIKNLVFLELIRLCLKKLTPKKMDYIDWPLPMSCVTQSCSCNIYSGTVPQYFFCQFVCGYVMTNFRKTTFSHVQQATAITVPITTME